MRRTGNHKSRSPLDVPLRGNGAAEALREGESHFRALADCAPAVVWMTDAEGKCTYISRFWGQLTGRSPKKYLGYRWSDVLHPEDRPQATQSLVDAVRGRRICEREYRLRSASGEYAWVFDHGVPYLDADGTYLGHVGICVDITPRKNREAERARIHDSLLRGQEAERTRIARELHDNIGQRLALLSVTLAEIEDLAVTGPAPLRKKLKEVREGVDTVASETHLMSHNLHPAMLAHLGLTPALRRLCKEFSARKELSIEFAGDHVAGDIPPEVATALFRIAQECLANVAKHSGARAARVELSQSDRQLQLTVADSGCGFDANQRRDGRGLGLISVRERVRMIGGEIEIDSAPSRGARICVSVQTQKRLPQGQPLAA